MIKAQTTQLETQVVLQLGLLGCQRHHVSEGLAVAHSAAALRRFLLG